MKLHLSMRTRLAWAIAIVVDALQIGLFPATGTLSTWFGTPLDLVAMAVLWRLLGWHWALAPSFLFEFLPIAELAPTWTLATWIILRRRRLDTTAAVSFQELQESTNRESGQGHNKEIK